MWRYAALGVGDRVQRSAGRGRPHYLFSSPILRPFQPSCRSRYSYSEMAKGAICTVNSYLPITNSAPTTLTDQRRRAKAVSGQEASSHRIQSDS